jgi:hypothetical protein
MSRKSELATLKTPRESRVAEPEAGAKWHRKCRRKCGMWPHGSHGVDQKVTLSVFKVKESDSVAKMALGGVPSG